MADVNDFYGLGDLATFNQAVQQSDPYGLVARQLNSWTPDASTWSPMATGVTSFGKAFLSGMLGNYARQNAADQMNAVVGVLPQLKANPMAVAAPEGVDADAFSVLKGNAILRNYAAQAQEAEADKKFNLDILSKFLGKKVEVLGENAAYDQMGQGGQNPNSPAYKTEQDKTEKQFKLDERISNARDYLKTSEEGRGLSALKPALSQVIANLDRNDKVSDLAVFTALAKSMDPVGAISEQTIKTTQDAIPYLEKKFGDVAGMFTGEGTLTREAKLKIARAVADKTNAIADLYGKAVQNEKKRLEVLGADPSMLTHIDYAPFDLSTLAPTLNQETYNQLRAQGLTKEQIKAQFGM